MVVCPSCGTMLEHDARFCGACGKRLEPGATLASGDTTAGLPSPVIHPSSHQSSHQLSHQLSAPGASPWLAAASAAREGTNPALASTAIAEIPPLATAGGSIRAIAHSPEQMIGRTLNNRYIVEAKIGEGGFGAVFRGKQIGTGREVALKILHPHNVGDSTIVARFRREAEACSKLRNPHTVTTYDFDEAEDGTLFLAMELLRGRSLHFLQKTEGPFPSLRVLGILDQVAQSLGEAHANGIVHRDMKPENVIVERREERDYVKVLDFGIAKMISGDREVQALTAVGQTLGTLEFMSPEQLRGQTLDGRADIYALGMMAYEMLTGGLPFKNAKSPIEIINFHMREAPPPPSGLRPELEIPKAVDDIIQKMVAKSRDQRHASAEELRAHIAEAMEPPNKGRKPAAGLTLDLRALRYPLIAAIAGSAVLLGVLTYLLRR